MHDGSEDEEDGGKTRTLTAQERAIFLEADALQIEMGNIVMKISASGTYTYDTARVRQHKDRYSALTMAERYVAELEEGRKRKLTSRGGMCIGVVTRM